MIRRNAARLSALVLPVVVLSLAAKEWSATLRPQNGSTISGTATAVPQVGDSLVISIRITGAKAGDTHPWHLHSGGCDSSGAVLGAAARYTPMHIGADQAGAATARVVTVLTVGVPYSVNVHRSPGEMGVIACGNLRPVAGE